MKSLLITAFAVSLLVFSASCSKEGKFNLTHEQALKINAGDGDNIIVESFGGAGPYRPSTGLRGLPGAPTTFKVQVDGEWQERHFEGVEGVSYRGEGFENESGDGFMVIRKMDHRKSPE